MTRRILALAAFASLLPIPALADDIGASEDVGVERRDRGRDGGGSEVAFENGVVDGSAGARLDHLHDQ